MRKVTVKGYIPQEGYSPDENSPHRSRGHGNVHLETSIENYYN